MKIDVTIGAGQTLEYFEPGDFFRLMEAASAVDVRFYYLGAEVSRADNVLEGYAERFRNGQFDRVQITSASSQAIQFVIRNGADVAYDKTPTGDVTLGTGAFTQAQKTVTNASGLVMAANASRRYLLIQNNDASGDIYITVDGSAATTAKGIKVPAGGALELSTYAPAGAVYAIGSIASNANIVAVEG